MSNRVHLVGPGGSPSRWPADQDETFLLAAPVRGPGDPLWSPSHLSSDPSSLDLGLDERVQAWLQDFLKGKDTAARAALRNQAPYLVSWATIHGRFARDLERALGGKDFSELTTTGLDRTAELIVQAFARDRGSSVHRGPATERTGPTRPVQKPRLPALRRWLADRFSARGSIPRETDVLVLALQSNATRAFLPVARELRERGVRVTFLLYLDDDASRALVEQQGFAFAFAERFASLGATVRAVKTALRLRRALRESLGELRRVLALPRWMDEETLGKTLLRGLLAPFALAAFRSHAFAGALSSLKPEAVVFITNRGTLNETLRAHDAGFRKIFFLQGLVPEIPPTSTPIDVDVAICGSSLDVPYLLRCGVSPEATHVTGYPDYDSLVSISRDECRAALRDEVKVGSGSPVVMFTSQYATDLFPEWARRRNLEVVLEVARRMPNASFVVKLHPLRESFPTELVADLPPNVRVLREGPTIRYLAGADVVVTYWSTTALEALLLGVPLVQLNATGLPDFLDLVGPLGYAPARDERTLEEAVAPFLAEASARKVFETRRLDLATRLGLEVDGLAAKRAADAIFRTLG